MIKGTLGSSGLEVSAIDSAAWTQPGLRPRRRRAGWHRPHPRRPSTSASHSSTPRRCMGPFTNEELVGKPLAPARDQVVIATKFGFSCEGSRLTGLDSRPEHIKATVEDSLRRLGVEIIDLLTSTAERVLAVVA
jgi:Aldo/keto reductase family